MEHNKKSTLKIVLIIFASILFYTVLQNTKLLSGWLSYIGQVMAPIIIGIALAFVINLPLNFFERRAFAALNRKDPKWWRTVRRPVCLVLSVLVLLGIVTLVICLIVPEVKDTAVGMIKALPEQAEALIADIKEWIIRLNLPIDLSETTLLEEIDWNSISKDLATGLTNTGGTVLSTTIGFTSNVLGGLFNFVVGLALSMYILGSKEKLWKQAKRLFRAFLPEHKCRRIFSVLGMSADIFTKFITGQLTEAVLIGVFCYIGMLIFRMPYAVMVSALISVTALIPVFGAFVGTAFGALMILFVSPLKAIGFVVFIVIIQQIDNNVIYPRIVGSSVGLPGIWVLCAVTVGGGLFGAVGMLLSVPVCAVIYCLVREYVIKREKTRREDDIIHPDTPN